MLKIAVHQGITYLEGSKREVSQQFEADLLYSALQTSAGISIPSGISSSIL
jgi:hypothetical protein